MQLGWVAPCRPTSPLTKGKLLPFNTSLLLMGSGARQGWARDRRTHHGVPQKVHEELLVLGKFWTWKPQILRTPSKTKKQKHNLKGPTLKKPSQEAADHHKAIAASGDLQHICGRALVQPSGFALGKKGCIHRRDGKGIPHSLLSTSQMNQTNIPASPVNLFKSLGQNVTRTQECPRETCVGMGIREPQANAVLLKVVAAPN